MIITNKQEFIQAVYEGKRFKLNSAGNLQTKNKLQALCERFTNVCSCKTQVQFENSKLALKKEMVRLISDNNDQTWTALSQNAGIRYERNTNAVAYLILLLGKPAKERLPARTGMLQLSPDNAPGDNAPRPAGVENLTFIEDGGAGPDAPGAAGPDDPDEGTSRATGHRASGPAEAEVHGAENVQERGSGTLRADRLKNALEALSIAFKRTGRTSPSQIVGTVRRRDLLDATANFITLAGESNYGGPGASQKALAQLRTIPGDEAAPLRDTAGPDSLPVGPSGIPGEFPDLDASGYEAKRSFFQRLSSAFKCCSPWGQHSRLQEEEEDAVSTAGTYGTASVSEIGPGRLASPGGSIGSLGRLSTGMGALETALGRLSASSGRGTRTDSGRLVRSDSTDSESAPLLDNDKG